MSYLALQTNQNILYPWKQIFPLKDNKRYWLWVEIPIIEFRAYFHQTQVYTLEGMCVWISWGNILLLTLYDPICIILKWKKLLNLITSLLLLGYSIGIFIRSYSIWFSYFCLYDIRNLYIELHQDYSSCIINQFLSIIFK